VDIDCRRVGSFNARATQSILDAVEAIGMSNLIEHYPEPLTCMRLDPMTSQELFYATRTVYLTEWPKGDSFSSAFTTVCRKSTFAFCDARIAIDSESLDREALG
jgi:hypothetical protein